MKYFFRFSLILLALLALFTSCVAEGGKEETPTTAKTEESSREETDATTEAEKAPLRDPQKTLRVLLIGNSFTYYNDMNQPDGIFARIAKNAGYPYIQVTSIYKGGYRLNQFLDRSDEYGAKVYAALESSTKYDIVVIQEQSVQPLTNPSDFYASCRKFKQLIDANGGEMYLYATWGYKEGHSSLSKYGKTPAEMEMKLRSAYTAIANVLEIPVIHAGAAMTMCHTEHPEIDLYNADLKHPSPAGSYLVAWTMFGKIFDVDPITLTYNGGMSPETANVLRATASEILKNIS